MSAMRLLGLNAPLSFKQPLAQLPSWNIGNAGTHPEQRAERVLFSIRQKRWGTLVRRISHLMALPHGTEPPLIFLCGAHFKGLCGACLAGCSLIMHLNFGQYLLLISAVTVGRVFFF